MSVKSGDTSLPLSFDSSTLVLGLLVLLRPAIDWHRPGKGSTFWFTFAARRFDESVDKELSLSGGSDAWASGSVSLDRTTDSGPLVGSGVGVPGAFVPNPDAVSEGISYVRFVPRL